MIDRDRENCLELLGPRVPNELHRTVYVAQTEATPLDYRILMISI